MLDKNFLVFFLVFPLVVWSFSDTEMDSLESSGSKSLSQSPWRTQIGFSLQRNVLLNSYYTENTGQDVTNPLNSKVKDSLLDPSSFYYAFSLDLNYSLADKIQNKEYNFFNWLRRTELFLSGFFRTPVLGYNNTLQNYEAVDYIHYAVGDITLGAATPIYAQEDFFSDVVFSFTPFPLSRFSQEAGFLVSYGGGINFLYFLKKSDGGSLAVSSGHNLSFREYSKKKAFPESSVINTPFSLAQRASFIYRQSHSHYIPASVTLSTSYYLGLNFEKQFNQDLGFSIRSSWKIKNQLYLSCALSWKDRIHIYNPDQPDIELSDPVDWFGIKKTVFSLSGSYSF